MPEGYCVKCKAKKEIVNAVEETMKNGRKAIKGKCPTCNTVMFKILGGKAANIQHATQIYSYLLRPTTANHNFADVVMRQFNSMLSGAPGERADYLHRLAPACPGAGTGEL